MKTNLTAALLSLAAAPLTAQNIAVAPSDHTDPSAVGEIRHLEGSGSTNSYPFSRGISRVMYLHEVWSDGVQLLDLPAGATITELGFPADSNRVSDGENLQLEVRMGHTALTTATMGSTFDANAPGGMSTVFPLGVLALPRLNDPVSGNVRVATVPLTNPFVYNGVDNLLVEFRITANGNGNQPFNYRLDRGTFVSEVESIGAGCASSSGSTPELTSSATKIGGLWRSTLRSAPANSLTALHIGFAPLPGPIPIPGAPGCALEIPPVLAAPVTSSGSGIAQWSFPIPDAVSNWRLQIYSQAVCIDVFANSLGVIASNGDVVTVGVDPRIALLAAVGNASAASGAVTRTWGQLTYFTYQ